MAKDINQIRIESILGGQSQTSYFAERDQFYWSLGIDPGSGFNRKGQVSPSLISLGSGSSSGLLNPIGVTTEFSPAQAINWFLGNPKDNNTYMYGASGSLYAFDVSNNFSSISDGGSLSNSSGNGAAYYDNYIYLSKNTTIARYGPLDGTPTFNGDYWCGTLGMPQLSNTSNYPRASSGEIPNHFLHRHSDGALYIADVVGNKGTIHKIQTTKTTVEGDTDNGSTFGVLEFGYGLWPTVIESYGEQIVVGLYEGLPSTSNTRRKRNGKIAFWDTTSSKFNSIIWEEFPDSTISSIKNTNGQLYITSGQSSGSNFRLSRYIGGYSIAEQVYIGGDLPPPGAVVALVDRLFFGSSFSYDVSSERIGVFSIGLGKSALGSGLFNVMPSGVTDNSGNITAIALHPGGNNNSLLSAWSGGGSYGVDSSLSPYDYSNTYGNPFWISQTYKIGQPFKVTKVVIPMVNGVNASTVVLPEIHLDSFSTRNTLTTINGTNYLDKKRVVIRPSGVFGNNDMNLMLTWSGKADSSATLPPVVGLPIIIEYELLDE